MLPDTSASTATMPSTNTRALSAGLRTGDMVFIRVRARLFRKVATATGTWTNHVGIVVNHPEGAENSAGSKEKDLGAGTWIAESTFPLSRITSIDRFIARAEHGRIAIARLRRPLALPEQIRIVQAASRRTGIWYDTGFNLHSRRQFCSRFVHEVLYEATGISVGEIQTFSTLLACQPDAALGFWRLWYFGAIPWQRETITPASVLHSPELERIFDGIVVT